MKILLVTYGSRGDVQPVLALGSALKQAGHEVILAGPPEYEGWAAGYGCTYRPIGGNFRSNVKGFPDPHTLRSAFGFIRLVRQEARTQFSHLADLTKDVDLLLGTSLVFGAPSAAELAGTPYGFIALCPQILPSAQHPPLYVKNHGLPLFLNQIAWKVGFQLDNLTVRNVVNRERERLGLPRVENAWHHLLGSRALVASDPELGDIPDDVLQTACQVGHFQLEEKGGLSREMEEFLASGPTPVYAGFGSMFSRRPEKVMRMVLQAVRSVGLRLIAAYGWSERKDDSLGDDCLIVNEVPHALLFPRVAAVVHHGGSGTTAAAARAGVPQVLVPHVMDQYYWANSVWTRGLGPKPIPRKCLNAQRLSQALKECLWDDHVRERAMDLGNLLRRENGLKIAVRIIESGFFHGDQRLSNKKETV